MARYLTPTKADIADALAATFCEGLAGDYWTAENLGADAPRWVHCNIPAVVSRTSKRQQFMIGDFLVTVSKPRGSHS